MNKRMVGVVFQKEWTDLIRDKRTWISALLIPIVIVPLLFLLIGYSMSKVEEEARAYIPFAVSAGTAPELIRHLASIPGAVQLHTDDPVQAIKDGTIRVAVEADANAARQIERERTFNVKLLYDPTNQKSEYAEEQIAKAVEHYAGQIMDQRLHKTGLTREWLTPIQIESQSVASKEQEAGTMLASVIPLVLLMALASGGMAAAVDLIAGEKERGTMETLLAAPVRAADLLAAKLLIVMLMGTASALASLASISFALASGQSADGGIGTLAALVSPAAISLLLMVVLLSAAMFAGLQLMISTLARTNKEAQTLMAPLVFAALVPSYILMPLNPIDIPAYVYALPLFNSVAVVKEVCTGQIEPLHAGLAIGSSVVYVCAAISFAAHFFRKERTAIA
ncbi:ABC transporter permease [Brevibacillus fluminis]|uniref:ABC transporter permease n=1 Tax=Brevibacillus fluminis TaxID=511487 RepID=UPI003F889180